MNPNGKAWHVEVHKDKQSMYFEGAGWIEAIRAHNLELGYFLVFSYKRNMVFNFKAYDLSTCEIAYPSVATKIKISKRRRTTVIKEEDLNSSTVIILLSVTLMDDIIYSLIIYMLKLVPASTKNFEVTMTTSMLSYQHLVSGFCLNTNSFAIICHILYN